MRIVTDNPQQFKKAHELDAGYDILSSVDCIIPANEKSTIPTGLKVAIPEAWVGVIKSRSGLSVKHELEVGAGIIDSGYRGEVIVVLRNNSCVPYHVSKGDKIAQMLVLPHYQGFVNRVDTLEESERDEGGFGSTGK